MQKIKSKEQNKLNTLRFFVISDIHLGYQQIEKLKKWYLNINKERFDYLLIPGDFDNLYQKEKKVDPKVCTDSEKKITKIFNQLDFFKLPIFYVPGNHDPYSLFVDSKKKLTANSTNMHMNRISLAEDLQLIGLGGALPGTNLKTGDKMWPGYPYFNEEEYKVDLKKLLEAYLSKSKQTIFMCHAGPNISGTINLYDIRHPTFNIPAKTGSDIFSDFVVENEFQERVFAIVHGHQHFASSARIGNVTILNPGSLRYESTFGMFEIVRSQSKGNWGISKYSSFNLKAFD